jgi:hypothetical protein
MSYRVSPVNRLFLAVIASVVCWIPTLCQADERASSVERGIPIANPLDSYLPADQTRIDKTYEALSRASENLVRRNDDVIRVAEAGSPKTNSASRSIAAAKSDSSTTPKAESGTSTSPLNAPNESDSKDSNSDLFVIEAKLRDDLDPPFLPETDVQPGSLERLTKLRQQVRRALHLQFGNPESVAERSSWGIMHAALSFGQESIVAMNGRHFNAIEWLASNGSCRGHQLMIVRNERLNLQNGIGYQGHDGQFLAILAQCQVPSTIQLTAENRRFQLQDILRLEMDTCKPKTELTFKLIGLSHYLTSDSSWVSDDGAYWNIERLVKEELDQPVIGAACGGTHRLMALSYSLKRRFKEDLPIDGEWKRSQDFLSDFVKYTLSLQNADGSFSTKWFEGREALPDNQRRLQTTGHILEWLVFTLDRQQLTDPRIVRAANYLTDLMLNNPSTKWEVGPRGHAIRALGQFNRKLFEDTEKFVFVENQAAKETNVRNSSNSGPFNLRLRPR